MSNELLAKEFAELTERLSTVEPMLKRSFKDLSRITKNLAEVDTAITKLSPSVNPEAIAPIHAWKGTYGKRGALKDFVLQEFKRCSPACLQTSDVASLAIKKFSLVFATNEDLSNFRRKRVGGAIQSLTRLGKLERGDDVIRQSQFCGTWRWKKNIQPTLASLSKQSKTIAVDVH